LGWKKQIQSPSGSVPLSIFAPAHRAELLAATRARFQEGRFVNLLIFVVDDDPDVEALFRQQFRRDSRQGRFVMEFAQSGHMALRCIADAKGVSLILVLSDINMPEMTGLELPKPLGPTSPSS
jgi:response regulator RpfG family c-di-GMP phosphodiesterase